MGGTCCGYSVLNKPNLVTNPQELGDLQTNINKCVEGDKQKSLKEEVHKINSDKLQKEKYEAFDVNGNAINGNNNISGEGLESSNIQSMDNGVNNQVITVGNQSQNNQNAINNPAEKGKAKEFGDDTLPDSTNLKLHIDLNAITEQVVSKPIEKTGGKSPKRNGPSSKKEKKPNKIINLQEIKLSDETTKKLTLLKEKSEKAISYQAHNSGSPQNPGLLRSMTINANANGEINNNNESECYEQSEKTKKMEEIKKEFIEDKRKLDKKQSDKALNKKSSRNNRNSPVRNDKESNSPKIEEVENWKQEEMKRLGSLSPKKSLLKRAKTIGEDLKGDKSGKKKVKFKDLDMKGKKKKK